MGTLLKVKPKPGAALDGRDRLRHFNAELGRADEAVSDLESRVQRLAAIVRDADAAQAAVQQAIADDGGVALAEYATGGAQDGGMAKLIATQEAASKAAVAAKAALPGVQSMLASARSEVARLEQQQEEEVLRYLTGRAGELALQCRRVFDALCRQHDQLAGISIALAPGQTSGDLLRTFAQVEIPRFARRDLPTVADPNHLDYVPIKRVVNEGVMEDSTASWSEARRRLMDNPDAELDDLIGPPLDVT